MNPLLIALLINVALVLIVSVTFGRIVARAGDDAAEGGLLGCFIGAGLIALSLIGWFLYVVTHFVGKVW